MAFRIDQFIMDKLDFEEFSNFRRTLFTGSLFILKHELVHVLYKLYVRLFKNLLYSRVNNSRNEYQVLQVQKLFSYKSDYYFSQRYMKEIQYIENVFEGNFELEDIARDEELNRILNASFRIIVSKYGYQMLLTCVEKSGFKVIANIIFTPNKQRLLVSDSLFTESYIGEGYISDNQTIEAIEKVNARTYTVGMLREHYNFIVKLEEIVHKKKFKPVKFSEVDLEFKYPIEKSSSTFLSNCPEYKNKFLVDFAKDYINRRIISPSHQPSVLMLNISDPEEKITCTEFNRMFKLFVYGTYGGKIRCIYLTQDSSKSSKEEYKKENQRLYTGRGPEDLLKPQVTLEASGIDTDSINLMGHAGAVLSLSLNYDSSYLVSGGADGSVRLWFCSSGTCLAIYRAHIKSVWSVKLAPRGYYFVSGGTDRIVYLWSTNSSSPLKKFIGHKEEVSLVDFTKNSIYVISASLDKTIRIWSADDCSVVRIFHFENAITWYYNKHDHK